MLPNGWEFIILIILAVLLLGPDRMPEYAAKLARFVVHARRMANDAKGQLREQMGPEFEDVNWRQYDPRQYDPRRIVKQALLEPLDDTVRDVREIGASTRADMDDLAHGRTGPALVDDDVAELTGEPAPYDVEAT